MRLYGCRFSRRPAQSWAKHLAAGNLWAAPPPTPPRGSTGRSTNLCRGPHIAWFGDTST